MAFDVLVSGDMTSVIYCRVLSVTEYITYIHIYILSVSVWDTGDVVLAYKHAPYYTFPVSDSTLPIHNNQSEDLFPSPYKTRCTNFKMLLQLAPQRGRISITTQLLQC